MRKLITILNAMCRTGETWQERQETRLDAAQAVDHSDALKTVAPSLP